MVYLRKLESWTNAACNAKKCYKPLPGLQTLRAVRSPYLSRPHLFADLVPDLDLGSRLISVRRCGRFHMSHAFCSIFGLPIQKKFRKTCGLSDLIRSCASGWNEPKQRIIFSEDFFKSFHVSSLGVAVFQLSTLKRPSFWDSKYCLLAQLVLSVKTHMVKICASHHGQSLDCIKCLLVTGWSYLTPSKAGRWF